MMKIIDAHMHFSNIASFHDCARHMSGVDYSANGYAAEAGACGIVRSVCMGLTENPPAAFPDAGASTPMLANLSDAPIPGLALCLGINPHTLTNGAIEKMEEFMRGGSRIISGTNAASELSAVTASSAASAVSASSATNTSSAASVSSAATTSSVASTPFASPASSAEKLTSGVFVPYKIVGIKIYAGYYYVDVNDPVYAPAYDFAEKHDLTVAIHSGDTFSERGKLIYSQPLSIDNLAVDRPEMRIVVCHIGAPWIYVGCEIAVKNRNVFIDLSGLHIGSAEYFSTKIKNPLVIDRYKQALAVMDDYDKVLFGTDWPLAPMASYIDFCKDLVPPETYDRVFYENAVRAFKLEELL